MTTEAPLTQRVREFRRAAGLAVRTSPTDAPPHEGRLALRLIVEEFLEVLEASLPLVPVDVVREELDRCLRDPNPGGPHLESLADALCDLDYVVEGARQVFGIPRESIEAEVHRANMDKFAGGTDRRRDDGKILKPDGWRPPDIAGVLWPPSNPEE